MKVKAPNIEIESNNPFQNDLFKRESFANSLTNLILNNNDSFVLSLNGKTTFLKMWQKYLENKDIPCIYFDAFKNDYTDDAFICVATEINDFVSQNKGVVAEKKSEFLEKSKIVGKKLFAFSGKVGLKALTLNMIDSSDIEELKNINNDIADALSDKFHEFVEEQFVNHAQNKGLFESYQ